MTQAQDQRRPVAAQRNEDSVVDAFSHLGRLAARKPVEFVCIGGAITFWALPCFIGFGWNLVVAHEPFNGGEINILLGHTVGWQAAGILSGGLKGADKEVRPQLTQMVNNNPQINNFNSRANSYNRTLSDPYMQQRP